MKYLGIHKLLLVIIVLFYLIVEIIFVSVLYIIYVIWNFNLPKGNWWHDLHFYRSSWDGSQVNDYNPWQTFIRRYEQFTFKD